MRIDVKTNSWKEFLQNKRSSIEGLHQNFTNLISKPCVANMLTEEHKIKRLAQFWDHIVTGDITWIVYYIPQNNWQSSEWHHSNSTDQITKIQTITFTTGNHGHSLPEPNYSQAALFYFTTGQLFVATQTTEQVLLGITGPSTLHFWFSILRMMDSRQFFEDIIQKLVPRLNKCLDIKGDYVEK